MTKREIIEENVTCLIGGIVMAIIFIALMLADGEKGLVDFF